MKPENFLFRVQQLVTGEDDFEEFECNFVCLCAVLGRAPINKVIKITPIDSYSALPLEGDLLPVFVESVVPER